jgi:DNA/RNA-binding domain of Phe-tRNA-synthetase-like protein
MGCGASKAAAAVEPLVVSSALEAYLTNEVGIRTDDPRLRTYLQRLAQFGCDTVRTRPPHIPAKASL